MRKFFGFLYLAVKILPGNFGVKVRFFLLSKAFPGCGKNFLVRENVTFLGIEKLRIGNAVMIGNNCCLDARGGMEIGDHVLLGPNVKIVSSYYDYLNTRKPFFERDLCYKKVTIGNGVWMGANVYVMPGVHLPDGCVVSACSVVVEKDYPPFSILAGNPCRIIGSRARS